MSWDDRFARLKNRMATELPPAFHYEMQVPDLLKEVKPQMYTPRTVSLGLNMRLEPGLEHHKTEFQRCFLKWKNVSQAATPPFCEENCKKRTGFCCRWAKAESDSEQEYTWEYLVEDLELDGDVASAYKWYNVDSSYVPPIILKNFLALDALFLVLFLRCSYQKTSRPPLPEKVYTQLQKQVQFRFLAESRSGIWRDVFLLENQIPLDILAKVWSSMPDLEDRPKEKALRLFNSLIKTVVTDRYLQLFQNAANDEMQLSKALAGKWFLDCDHLLDCLHQVVCYSPSEESDRPPPLVDEKALAPASTIPSAVQLQKAGICLKSDGILFIYQTKFEDTFWGAGPVLHLPRICMSDQTESLLRNLAVFEMVSCPSERQVGPRRCTITSYLALLDKLIQSQEDVELMRKTDILISCLGSNGAMIEAWDTLCKHFSLFQSSQWKDMLSRLTTRYKSTKYQYYAEFRAKYFERPWVVASWVVGIVLLGLTGVQTGYTSASYYKSPAPHS